MLLFGHIGITVGVGKTCDILMSIAGSSNGCQPDSSLRFDAVFCEGRLRLRYWLNRIKDRITSIDYRLVLLGSLLPDIIDKPVWFFVGNNTSLSGRDYAHTLLFNLPLLISGLVLIGYRKSWLLILSLASFMHLILDQMWDSPETLLWPLLGSLPEKETVGWLSNIFQGLLYPEVYIPEIIGLAIILLFIYRLLKRGGVTSFIRKGAIS
ncbi:metal-dependent hydrolase [Chloroflexota bacterium]